MLSYRHWVNGRFAVLIFMVTACFPTARAELIAVEMEGARERIYLDLEKGALFIGNDCSPLLYFQKELKSKSSINSGQYYRVLHTKSRKALKTSRAPRLPDKIWIKGNAVEIVSNSAQGYSRAYGRAVIGDIKRRAARNGCL